MAFVIDDLGLILAGIGTATGLASTIAQAAAGQPKPPPVPVSGVATGPAPLTGGVRQLSPLVGGKPQPAKYAAIAELLRGA